MKFGIRKRSYKKSFKARTTGKYKRRLKKAVNPLYGKKGMGMIRNPKKSLYNKVYRKTTIDRRSLYPSNLAKAGSGKRRSSPRHYKRSGTSAATISGDGLLLAFVIILGVLSFIAPVLIAVFAVLLAVWLYNRHKANSRYTKDQIQRLSEFIPADRLPSGKISGAKMSVLADSCLDNYEQEFFNLAEKIDAQTNIGKFFDLFNDYRIVYSNMDKIKAINAEPDPYVSSMNSNLENVQNSFIDRSFKACYDSAASLKTEKGRKNRYQKWIDEIMMYSDILVPSAIEKIELIRTQYAS